MGFDARETSPHLAKAVTKGICDQGAEVFEIGLSGTEEIYSAVSTLDIDAGIEITASHNPIDYNGMKIIKNGSQPLSEYEFASIKHLVEGKIFAPSKHIGSVIDKRFEARERYLQKILEFFDLGCLKPLKILINSGNGAAGPVIDAFEHKFKKLGVKTNFVCIQHQPDSSFPNGIPNPLLEQNRSSTTSAIIQQNADFGVAFDGDFDRCFLFDNFGDFVPGEYLVGLLSEVFLGNEKGAKIVHDTRVIWNTLDVVSKCQGSAIACKTGHAFVKAEMRNAEAVYGGEMSAHHYFRDFFYCDSGMIPWFLVWELLSRKNISLADLIKERKKLFPSSGEINFRVSNAEKCIKIVKSLYGCEAKAVDEMDGLSISFEKWRFNLRKSNTEPLVRLNVEARGDKYLLRKKIEELTEIIFNV